MWAAEEDCAAPVATSVACRCPREGMVLSYFCWLRQQARGLGAPGSSITMMSSHPLSACVPHFDFQQQNTHAANKSADSFESHQQPLAPRFRLSENMQGTPTPRRNSQIPSEVCHRSTNAKFVHTTTSENQRRRPQLRYLLWIVAPRG